MKISQVEGVHTYLLDADLLNIISIVDNEGNPYSLNRLDDSYIASETDEGDYNVSTDTTGFTYDYGVDGRVFSVTYKAKSASINPIGLDPATTDIDVHPGVLQPLLFLVASRVFASLPTLDGVNKSMEYMLKYNDACEVIQKYGLIHNIEFANNKSTDRGWP